MLVNQRTKTVVIHDVTSQPNAAHLKKGERYREALQDQFEGYTIEYKEGYWEGMEDVWEALSKEGELYLPAVMKPD